MIGVGNGFFMMAMPQSIAGFYGAYLKGNDFVIWRKLRNKATGQGSLSNIPSIAGNNQQMRYIRPFIQVKKLSGFKLTFLKNTFIHQIAVNQPWYGQIFNFAEINSKIRLIVG